MKKRVFYINSIILTSSSVLLRLVHIWFRAYICAKIGASGMGLYQLILSVFILGITLCCSGISLTVTRLVSEGRATRGTIRRCAEFAACLSLIATSLLYFSADFISVNFIGNPSAAVPLKLLSPSLIFIAVSSCLKGYFLAIRNTIVGVTSDALEQFVTIGASIILLNKMKNPLNALMISLTIGDFISFIYIVIIYLIFVNIKKLSKAKGSGVIKSILHIAVPIFSSSFFRSLLSSTENVLIPRGLKKYGANDDGALAQYGVMHGMVMPILYFPSTFLSALSVLLIPEMAQAKADGKRSSIQRYVEKAFRYTLMFSFIITSVVIVFADNIGVGFYKSHEVGNILRIMAPIIPLLYLDHVVDAILKGLDQQIYSFKYNISDSIMRVIFIAIFVPIFGIKAYITIIFMSEIYNASLSINRLLKVTSLKVDIVGWIIAPSVCAALLYYVLLLLQRLVNFIV